MIHRQAVKSLIGFTLAATIVAGAATASTINFNDIDASSGDVILDGLSPYQGYTWTNLSVYTSTPGFPGFNNGIVSPPNAAYTSGDALGVPIISMITSPAPFNFGGGYFGSGWYDEIDVTVNGLFDRVQRFTQTFTVDTESPRLITLDFSGINEVDIYSSVTASTSDPYGCGPSGCSQITLDDLTLTPASGPPVSTPEPSAALLVAVGILAAAIVRGCKSPQTAR